MTEIAGVAGCLPPGIASSDEVEARLRRESPRVRFSRGMIESATGIRARRRAEDGVESSDLAAGAAKRVLAETGLTPGDVDLLIFAAASQDLTEPATANIVQEKVGTNCPVFDLKNACNSFLNALQAADAFIRSGMYRTVLVATGEIPSRGINWTVGNRRELKASFMGYTFGDAGAAAVLRPATGDRGILYLGFQSVSRHWDIATIPGGGSMHPRGDQYTTFRGDGEKLRKAFAAAGTGMIDSALTATGTRIEDFQRVLVHQVSSAGLEQFLKVTRIDPRLVEHTVCELGNMASASLPIAYAQAQAAGRIRPGGLVLWAGLAAGISLSVMVSRA